MKRDHMWIHYRSKIKFSINFIISSKLISQIFSPMEFRFWFFLTNCWIILCTINDLKLLIGSVRIEESRFLSVFYHLQQLWKDTFSLPSVTSSSTVFAKGLPRVSGNIEHNKPAISAKPPQSVVGPHHITAPNKSAT